MEKREYSSSNYFLFVTTRTYFYEYYKCPDCGTETEHKHIATKSFSGGSDWNSDEDE